MLENKLLSEAVLESIIGKHGVSPEAKQNLATKLAELLNEKSDDHKKSENGKLESNEVSKEEKPIQVEKGDLKEVEA